MPRVSPLAHISHGHHASLSLLRPRPSVAKIDERNADVICVEIAKQLTMNRRNSDGGGGGGGGSDS